MTDFIETFSNGQIRVIGPELILGNLYDKIGFNAVREELFRHPAVSRLFSPGSKLKTVDYLERYQGVKYFIDKIYRFLDNPGFGRNKENSADKKMVSSNSKCN